MKNKAHAALRSVWTFLTVIPGWHDAGRLARVFYALPLLLPLLGLGLLAGWEHLHRRPQMARVRAQCAVAVQTEAEIAALRLEWSDEQARALADESARRADGLFGGVAEVNDAVAAMRAVAATHGWTATLHLNDPEADPSAPVGVPLAFRSVRGRLQPSADNPAPFASLRRLLDRLVPENRPGGLTRLAVHADEQGRLSVELGVRFAVRPPDEKAP